MSVDVIGDFLTVIRNGVLVAKPFVTAPHSNMKHAIARILLEEGYIRGVDVIEADGKKSLKVFLKYVGGESAIHEIKRESTPGRRYYAGKNNFKKVIGGLGLSVLTTDRGLLSDRKARELNVGGEVICTVW